MLYTWDMETTQIGKLTANVKSNKVDFSDIEASFYCVAISDEFGTVILADANNNRIVAE